jgi:hypothetical protein
MLCGNGVEKYGMGGCVNIQNGVSGFFYGNRVGGFYTINDWLSGSAPSSFAYPTILRKLSTVLLRGGTVWISIFWAFESG